MAISVFVSYSHEDASLVTPVVKLLRLNKELVFQDLDSIEPGKRWRDQVNRALTEAHLVVLFWCAHSSLSSEVESEYKCALGTGKDLLPVLLDATPLPSELNEFQWIDFRGTVGANHGYSETSELKDQRIAVPPAQNKEITLSRPAEKSSVRFLVSLSALLCFLTIMAGFFIWYLPTAPPVEKGPPGGSLATPVFSAFILIAVGFFLWRLLRRLYKRPKSILLKGGETFIKMAEELEAEILRRGVSSSTGDK